MMIKNVLQFCLISLVFISKAMATETITAVNLGDVVSELNQNPVQMLGHVTSSYFSSNLNKSIALAVVRGGKDMIGKKLFIPMETKTINVTVANPVFFDEGNKRLNA